jgi:hypothetical protein
MIYIVYVRSIWSSRVSYASTDPLQQVRETACFASLPAFGIRTIRNWSVRPYRESSTPLRTGFRRRGICAFDWQGRR